VDRIERLAVQIWRPLTAILILSAALILTHSRGGFLSTAIAGIVLLVCCNYRRRFRNRRSLYAIALAIAAAGIVFFITSEVLLKRIDHTRLDENSRLIAYQVITASTRDNPILGFGYGTFADSFRLYRTDTINAYLDRAHNTYLENAFELGWPAALLLFAVIATLFLTCIQGLRRRGRDWIYPATGIAATVLVAIHSYFDFSLQMPAVAMTYACILGVACAQAHSSNSD
jgi:O-antigen ligase